MISRHLLFKGYTHFYYLAQNSNLMKKTLPALIALTLLSISCAKEKNITKAEWLIGNWDNKSAEGYLVENWKKVNDSVFNGESYFIVGNDTVFAETVVLDDVSGKMAYTVTVPGQNAEKPVRFDMTSITDNEMVFKNPGHDFPAKIVYTHPSPDSLVAVIYGKKEGKPASETFKMAKKK